MDRAVTSASAGVTNFAFGSRRARRLGRSLSTTGHDRCSAL